MNFLDPTLPLLDDDQRATNAPSIRGDVDALLLHIDVDGNEFVDPARAPQATELLDEARTAAGQAEHVAVEVDDEVARGVDLVAVEDADVCVCGFVSGC